MDPHRLTVIVTHSDGTTSRWAADAPTAENIPGNLAFTTSIPGGHKDCTFTLPRSIDASRYRDEGLFDDVQIQGPGGTLVWQGRVSQLPRSHEESATLTVNAVGYATNLLDNATFREVYVDRDFGRWTDPTLIRQAAHVGATPQPWERQITKANSNGLSWGVAKDVEVQDNDTAEFTYDAGAGLAIAFLQYQGKRVGSFTGFENPTLYVDDAEDINSASGYALTYDDTLRSLTVTAPLRHAMLRLCLTAAPTTPSNAATQSISKLAVYGNHGLTLRDNGSNPDGVFASDVVADVIARMCPQITSTSIEATSFVIPHLVFADPTTAEDAISRVNAYHNWRWGVWGREFFFRPHGYGSDVVTWEARKDEGAKLNLEGDDGSQVINGLMVFYNDGISARTAGPTGSGADTESATLLDSDEANPCNRAGITRYATLTLSTPADATSAVQIGAAYLAERNLPSRRGGISLTGWARHPTEGLLPCSRVRAGDWIRITDLAGDVPREIISTTYDDATRTVRCDVGGQVARLDAILERLGVTVGLLQ